MSPVEITAIILGHYEVSREYDFTIGERVNHYEWIDGCGPSGEVGIQIYGVYNVSSKEIKEVEFTWIPVDSSGDVVGKEIKCKTKKISSYDKDETDDETDNETDLNVWERLWNAPTAQEVKIITVGVTYSDGTEEFIAGEDIKFTYDEDSEYRKRLKAEEEKKEAEKKIKEQAEINKKLEEENSRKSRGIVAYAGKVDGKDYAGENCKIETIGDVVFYLKKANYGLDLIGWESKKAITHLELPLKVCDVNKECLKNTSIKSVMFPRTMKSINYKIRGRTDTNLGITEVEKIVIPKETEYFSAEYRLLGSIEEIEFEDPCGWGVSQKIITDPKKMYEYILNNESVSLHKSNSIIRKILYKLGF